MPCRSHSAAGPRSRGFTLLEVLLVLGILVLLAAIVTPSLFNRQRKAMIRTTQISIAGLEGALRLYAAEHEGEYPVGSPAEVFALLMNPGNGDDGRVITPYVEKLPVDAWGQTLYYEFPTSRHRRAVKPAIWSAGPDQKNDNGAHDDINNWDEGVK
ncbi:MAG: type II secretion system protein GspG [Planctomycetota bacterium]|nr:type II secretion system protein GspG [Planctomycetota bacterium]